MPVLNRCTMGSVSMVLVEIGCMAFGGGGFGGIDFSSGFTWGVGAKRIVSLPLSCSVVERN